jgi:dTDP-glucose 4,6-dehydratase
MPKTILITGAGGFAGHHFLEHVLATTDWNVIATDSFRHKGRTDRIAQILDNQPPGLCACLGMCQTLQGCPCAHSDWRKRVKIVTHDLCAPFTGQQIRDMQRQWIDYIAAFASESHVDRSISDPVPFIRNNTEITYTTLELARKLRPEALIWVSTDEVYGPVEADDYKGHYEWSPILPSNPYAASKAAQEAIAISYWRTYGVPLVIVNCMNMIGERQDTEKFVPMVISKVLKGETVTIHGTPGNVGTRHYLHARNLAHAMCFILGSHSPAKFPAHGGWPDTFQPDRYNIASPDRIDNLTLAKMIADDIGGQLHYELEDFHSTRPGHDPHYGLDPAKLNHLGWKMPVPFRESLRKTVKWTLQHQEWLLPD